METKVAGIALESNQITSLPPLASASASAKFSHQHKRNGRFTTTLITHGFARDNSMFAAARATQNRIRQTKNRFEAMDNLVEDFDREVTDVSAIQHELIKLQRIMATRALEVFSVRVIQQAVRSWVARHKLMILKISRFIFHRIYFLRYYKRRVRAACKLALRMLIFLAKRLLKTHKRRKQAAILIQKLYHKWRLLNTLKFRMIVLGKMGRLLKHYMLFGKCRAVMHMRRLEVQRVQDEEQIQYTELLALEQQRQAEEELRLAEERRQLEEIAMKKARAKMIALAKKQAKEAALAEAAALKNRARGARGAKDAKPVKGTAADGPKDVDIGDAVMQLSAAHNAVSTSALDTAALSAAAGAVVPADNNAEPVDPYTAPVNTALILKAVSAGIITGQNTSQAMHNLVYNRYGSVYGGMYGEYCCVQDNRVRSFAAVRFRFMLRCFRKKRLKALNGPNAKTFFYMLSHLHNTPHERHPNEVVKFLQTLIRTYAIKRAARATNTADGAAAGSGGMGKMLLSSFRRTNLNSTMALNNLSGSADTDALNSPESSGKEKEGPASPPKQRVSPSPTPTKASNLPFRDNNPAVASDASNGTFVMQKPFGGSSKAQDNNPQYASQEVTSPGATQYPAAQRSGTQLLNRESRIATYPTYTIESFPTCFVTGSYRPRTLAELVLMIIDMKRAVIKAPSLVDDNTPPVKIIAKLNPRGVANAVMNTTMRGKNKNAAATAASTGASPGPSAGPSGGTGASPAAANSSGNAVPGGVAGSGPPPPLMRGDSGINRAAKLKSASTVVPGTGSSSSSPERAVAASENKGTPERKVISKIASSSEHMPSPDVNLPSKESALRSSEPVSLATAGKGGSFKGKLVPSAPAPLIKQHSGTGGALAGGANNGAMTVSLQEPGSGTGSSSVPAQLRANSRILRPSMLITTPAPVPSPYPTTSSASVSGSSAATPTAASKAPAPATEHSNTAHLQDLDLRADYRRELTEALQPIQNVQSITPSAIIAAAKATLREAETTNSVPTSGGTSRRQSLSSRGMQLSALDASRKTPTARTPNNNHFWELEDSFLGSVEEKIQVDVDL